MNPTDSMPDPDDEAIPPMLRDALAGLNGPAVNVPAALDARILASAKCDYARRTRFRPAIRWISAVAAVAAAVAIALIVHATLIQPARHLARGDINGDGKVDMLDAYVLAKRVASRAKLDRAWDVNGDGNVDQKDADWIANAAVNLDGNSSVRGGAQ